jgi:hypothetical protein
METAQQDHGIMKPTLEDKNKAIVLEAFDTLFSRRDYAAAKRSHPCGSDIRKRPQ